MPISVGEIKSLQYVIIVKAGLAVTEGPGKSIEKLQVDVMVEYNLAVANAKLPRAFMIDFDRSCNQGNRFRQYDNNQSNQRNSFSQYDNSQSNQRNNEKNYNRFNDDVRPNEVNDNQLVDAFYLQFFPPSTTPPTHFVRLNTRCHLLAFAAKVEKQLQATVSIQ